MPCLLPRNVKISATEARFGLLRSENKSSFYDLPGYDAVSYSSRRTAVLDDTADVTGVYVSQVGKVSHYI